MTLPECLCVFHPNTASGPNQVHSPRLFSESVNETKGLGLFLEELVQEKKNNSRKP